MRAKKASIQEFQLVNCMETQGRSRESPESKSCQSRLLVVIHPWEGKHHPSSSTCQEELQKTQMNLNCQPDIKLLSSNWLPGRLLLLCWPKKLLLGIACGISYRLSYN